MICMSDEQQARAVEFINAVTTMTNSQLKRLVEKLRKDDITEMADAVEKFREGELKNSQ